MEVAVDEKVMSNEVVNIKDMLSNDEQVVNADLRTFIRRIFPEQGNILDIIDELNGLMTLSNSRNSSCVQDNFNIVTLVCQNVKGYIRLMNTNESKKLLETTQNETSKYISSLFGIDNSYMYFHDVQSEGLIRVCKLALQMKYSKYGTDGFTALYTRPPVIYISGAAPTSFGQELRNELGLPQSSICKVPCNTMFGSSYTMDVAAFERLLTDDVSCGKTPLILISYAGTPSAGHTDNLSRLREICTQSGVWLHVEGDSLATLGLQTVPPSVSPATSADSLTLNLPSWFGAPNLPFCTSYKAPNQLLAEFCGLISRNLIESLTCLPLWMLFKAVGSEQLKNVLINAVELAQQLSHRIDMVSGIKRIEQSNVTSPKVVFKYKASPTISYSSSTSIEDDDDEVTTGRDVTRTAGSKTTIDVTPKLCDALNAILAENLQRQCEKVRIEVAQVAREGCCMSFSPLRSARALGTGKDDINEFVEDLEKEIMKLDSTLIARNFFEEAFRSVSDVHLIDTSEEPAVGAFQCIPSYWKVKDMSNLSDSKKKEVNDLNQTMLGLLSKEFDYLAECKTADGQIFIRLGVVDESFDLNGLSERVKQVAEELEDNSKLLESLSDAVQKSIHEAEAGLQKESEEKFFEEGVLRHVPLIGSVFSWLSPPTKDSHGVTGRAFNLTSGKLQSTEKTYKYKMQLQNEEEGSAAADEGITKSSSLDASSQKENREADVGEAASADAIVDGGEASDDVKQETDQSNLTPDQKSDINTNNPNIEEGEKDNTNDAKHQDADTSSNKAEVGVEVKESDV